MAKKFIGYLQHAGKSYWREILAVLLLLLGIYFFRSQRHELLSLQTQLGNSHTGWIVGGIAVTIIYILFQAAMYRSSFAAIGSSLKWSHAIDLFLKRNFLSVFLTAGGVSSLAYAPSYLKKNGINKMQTGQASAIYAFVGILTVFLIALPVIIISLFEQERFENIFKGLVALFAFIVLLIFIVYSLRQKKWLYQQVNKRFPKIIFSIDEFFSVKISNRQGILTIVYSLFIELCGIVHIFFACK